MESSASEGGGCGGDGGAYLTRDGRRVTGGLAEAAVSPVKGRAVSQWGKEPQLGGKFTPWRCARVGTGVHR